MVVDIEKIKSEGGRIKTEVREKTRDLILAAFGFVAGLAWNEAIKSLIEEFLPNQNNSVWAKLAYALLVTLLIVVISTYFIRSASKTTESKDK